VISMLSPALFFTTKEKVPVRPLAEAAVRVMVPPAPGKLVLYSPAGLL